LTQTITTSTTPRYVNTVRTLKGKVWHVNAPGSVILSLPDGTNHMYKVPAHAKFKINGQDKTVFQLKKGMAMEATIVTDSTETVVAANKSTTGQAPAPALPLLAGVLLIQPSNASAPDTTTVASAEQPPAILPETGSLLPLAGLLGMLGIASAAGLGIVRKRAALPQA
jgi:LPXTG-motif cell wall-anchored protein